MDLIFQVPIQYCSFQHQTTSSTSHIHNWVLFLLWLHLFILSGVSSPLIYSSMLGTYQPGEFIFQCPIFLPFHAVHGVLKARILKWFAIPFSAVATGLEKVSFHSNPKGKNTKECSNWFEKSQRNQRSNCQHLLDHQNSKRVPEKHLFLLH